MAKTGDWRSLAQPGRLSRRALLRGVAIALGLGAGAAGFDRFGLGGVASADDAPVRVRANGAARRQAPPAREVRRGDTSQAAVALSFDAGADTGYAALILDTLADQGVAASFGMTGLWARQNPDLVRRMIDEGHELINHTWDHKSWTGLSTKTRPLSFDERRVEIERTEDLIHDIAGVDIKPYFRSPFGDTDNGVLADLGALGYRFNILWTVDSRGWLKVPAAEIVRHCLANSANGAIYVMHVGGESEDGPALLRVIAGLRDQGYGFARLSAIITG